MSNKRASDLLSRLTANVTSLYKLHLDEGDNSRRPSVIELIQNENCVLKSENVFLRERIEIMANTISELNNKVMAVDQEKESLLTAIRLIYDDNKANLLD